MTTGMEKKKDTTVWVVFCFLIWWLLIWIIRFVEIHLTICVTFCICVLVNKKKKIKERRNSQTKIFHTGFGVQIWCTLFAPEGRCSGQGLDLLRCVSQMSNSRSAVQ